MRRVFPAAWRSRALMLLRAVAMVAAVGMLIEFLPIDLAILLVSVLAMAAQVAASGLRHRLIGPKRRRAALSPPS